MNGLTDLTKVSSRIQAYSDVGWEVVAVNQPFSFSSGIPKTCSMSTLIFLPPILQLTALKLP